MPSKPHCSTACLERSPLDILAADGTKYDLAENSLLAEYSIRYGAYGGIAYHNVADTYIALFSHFIPCGVWEAIYILEGAAQEHV